ncbi:MAG TPA: acyl-CoA dehydrogenase family protein, partial [Microbacterium sp.]|nr:acyl-CoA dehydrogenase family protein [Microbacterium sp.]
MTMDIPVAEQAGQHLTADDRSAILEAVREYAASELAPYAIEWDAAQTFPREALARGGELGLGGLYIREDVGGSALSRLDAAAIVEELAKADASVAAYITIHNMVAWMIDSYGTDEQRQEWLPRLVAMSDFGAYCLTEPGAGSDAAAIATSAIRSGDDYVLTGVKQFISGGGEASVYVVMARTGEPGARGITAFLVPDGTPGLSFGVKEQKMGWKAQPTRQVILDEVRVPAANVLGVEGQGFKIAMAALNGGRVSIAACSLGGAQWALDRAVQYVQERFTFGEPLA